MGSFIDIPRRYDVTLGGINSLDVICTDHKIPLILRRVEGGFVGVDEIMKLIEHHENKEHQK